MEERLQKIIARAGVASRRHAEELISSGQVAVNGQIVTELGTKADAERDHIRVAGKLLHATETKVYLALHKPDGVVATLQDPEGRKTIAHFLRGVPGRVFPVGRLEYHASGLMLLTNDGELANRMMRARELKQEYLCKIDGALNDAEVRDVERRGRVKMQRAKGMPSGWWEVKASGVSKDEFRKTLIASGHHVDKLRRMAIGNIELGSLAPGEYRHLTREEVADLERAVAKAEKTVASGARPSIPPFQRQGRQAKSAVSEKRRPFAHKARKERKPRGSKRNGAHG
ncbi:MAG: pseudouridine synthase [Candidatus Acidiferrales bacterium]